MDNNIRAFIAAKISESACDKLYKVQRSLRDDLKDARWIKRDNLHITLKFIGNVNSANINDISSLMDLSLASFKPCKVWLKGLGVFPDERNPRVIWVGMEGETYELVKMANTIGKELFNMGIKGKNNHFTPHITIGRFKKKKIGKNCLDLIQKHDFEVQGDFVVNEIVLFKSVLSSSGAFYEPLYKKILKN